MSTRWFKVLVPALALAALPVLPTVSQAAIAVGVSINLAPPVLPVYVQPPLPAPGYIWTPGYWAYGDDGYYWVPGTWVLPPQPGLLWTPGYWGWVDGGYFWHAGYWGPHVGFYGGVNYGFGYTGVGFVGGYWSGGAFFYNHACSNFGGVHVTNVYNRTVINNINVTRVSYNGGNGGTLARPTAGEMRAEHEHHFQPTSMQMDHQHMAAGNRELRDSVNHGRPPVAATSRPGQFSGRGVVAARASGPHGGAVGGGANEHMAMARETGHPNEPGRPNMNGPAGGLASHMNGAAGHPKPIAQPNEGGRGFPGGGAQRPSGGAPQFSHQQAPQPGRPNYGGGNGGGRPNFGGGQPNYGGGHPNFGGGGQPNYGGGHPNFGGGGQPNGGARPNFGGGQPGGGGRPSGGAGHPNGNGGGHHPEGHR